VLFTGSRSGADGSRSWIGAKSLETGEQRLLVDGTNAHYSPSGHLLFMREGSDALWAVAFDPDSLSVAGEPIPVLDGVYLTPGNAAHVSLSATGTLVYVPSATHAPEHRFVWVERNGVETSPATDVLPATPWDFRLSPSGDRLATSVGLFSEARIWIYDLVQPRPPYQLTFDGRASAPIWEPDGSRVVFNVGPELRRIPADGGTRESEPIAGLEGYPHQWSPDGRHLLFGRGDDTTGINLFLLTRGASTEVTPWLVDEFYESEPAISPTGNWVAYVSDQTSSHEVYLRPLLETGVAPIRVSADGGREPRWSPDGSELFFRSDDQLFVTAVDANPSQVSVGPPTPLFRNWALTYQPHPTSIRAYDVASDGRFLMVEDTAGSQGQQIVAVLNWFEELKARVPTP
jgi:hypothetical protein